MEAGNTQPILVSLGAHSLSVATPVVVSDGVDVWVALQGFHIANLSLIRIVLLCQGRY